MAEFNATRLALIEILADGEFHSGEKLGEVLGISRAAINNHIKALAPYGLEVFKIRGRGYRLERPLSLLSASRLAQETGCGIECFPVIDSTNQYLLNKVTMIESGHSCLAECQLAGRGRRGREWISPFGSHLYMSTYWKLEQGMSAAMGLSLVVGIALTRALQRHGIDSARLKWPNDLYLDGKKLAGILVEMAAVAGDACHLVIGIGLNVSMPNAAGNKIDQPWTDLASVMKPLPTRTELAASVLNELCLALKQFERDGLAPFVPEWNRLDYYLDQSVTLHVGNQSIVGIAKGIDEQGALLLEAEGQLRAYVGGEISLRGQPA